MGRGGEEEHEGEGVEEEEEEVEVGELFTEGVELGFFEGDSAEDEFLFFEPLLEEELVGWSLGDLVKWVEGLCLDQSWGFDDLGICH